MAADAARPAQTLAASEIRAALDRIALSPAFLRSAQLQRLLRFLVEEWIAGRDGRLKEYVIGVEVFGRTPAFDPRADSLVRVEARRLRAALEAYYQAEGRADPIVIDVPKGSYRPSVRKVGPAPPRPTTGGGRNRLPNILLVLAVTVAIVAAAAAWLTRSRRVQALSERDFVVIADFANSTGEPIFDDTLRQGLAVHLEQSPFLNIVSDRRTAQILELMGRSPSDRVTRELVREVCVRAGGRAAIVGSIARLGSEYVLGLTASTCATGEDMAHVQAEAASREGVLKALSAAATELRGKLGESLDSIRQFDTPIEDVTTPSLDALQAYSLGRKTAREKGSPADIPFYARAIELDPDFAVAHAALGVSYVNLGQPSAAAAHLEKAYRLRDRVSEREKYRIAASYHHAVTGEVEKAREVYELWKRSYPREIAPYINLGMTYTWLGDYETSVAVTTEALRLEPGNVLPYSNLAALSIKLGRFDEAAATLSRARARGLVSRFTRCNLAYLGFLQQDASVIEQQLAEVRDRPGDADPLLSIASDSEAYHGRLERARELSRRAIELAARSGANEAAAGWQVNSALREAEFGNAPEARRAMLDALRLSAGRDVVALAALAAARIGDQAQADGLRRELEKNFPRNSVLRLYWLPTISAAVKIARGEGGGAVRDLQAAAPYELASPPPLGLATLYPVYLRGEAYLLTGDGVSATTEFQKILDRPGLVLNFPLHALSRLQLGRARAMSGDVTGARQAYQDFFALWKTADREAPVLKKAGQEYDRIK